MTYPYWIGDGSCNTEEYNTAECGWDGGDCLIEKYPNCKGRMVVPSRIGDGWCDDGKYNTEECGWDGGDCNNSAGTFLSTLQILVSFPVILHFLWS